MSDAGWDALDDETRAWLSTTLATPKFDRPPPGDSAASAETKSPLGEQSSADLFPLLALAVEMGASDVHLSAGCAPHVRVAGGLRQLADQGPIARTDLESFLLTALTVEERATLIERGDLDTSFTVRAPTRSAGLRASIFRQSGSLAVAFRIVPSAVPSLASLGLPSALEDLATASSGLVLVTGSTGSGKSTTLAAMVDFINRTQAAHIITIEDPIEFRHEPVRSIVRQRAVGSDTESFASGLRHALRQDPDVVMLGELRDLESIRIALTAAETGHLVLATLHSIDAAGAIHRLIDVFPPSQQTQIRSQLALSLRGIVAQELVQTNGGRAAIAEVLIATDAVRNLIRDEKVHQLQSVLEAGSDVGMQTMGQARRLHQARTDSPGSAR